MLNSRLMKLITASSIFTPPTRMEWLITTPPSEMTATSVVPPPMSTTMQPLGSNTGRPLPSAARKGFSTRYTLRLPAYLAASPTARRSMAEMEHG